MLLFTTRDKDKPRKYPTIFNTAEVAVITKLDLAEALELDLQSARAFKPCVRRCECLNFHQKRARE